MDQRGAARRAARADLGGCENTVRRNFYLTGAQWLLDSVTMAGDRTFLTRLLAVLETPDPEFPIVRP